MGCDPLFVTNDHSYFSASPNCIDVEVIYKVIVQMDSICWQCKNSNSSLISWQPAIVFDIMPSELILESTVAPKCH